MVDRIRVQPQLLEVLRDLPTCTRVGVRRNVVGIEEFYTLISGEDVELNGFVDLSAVSAAEGFKLRARNMTALGVQVVGTVLNKTVSTGDDFGVFLGLISPPVSRSTELEITVWLYLLLCSCWNNTQRFVPRAGYHVQDSEDRAVWSCILGSGVDPEKPGRSGAASGC